MSPYCSQTVQIAPATINDEELRKSKYTILSAGCGINGKPLWRSPQEVAIIFDPGEAIDYGNIAGRTTSFDTKVHVAYMWNTRSQFQPN